MNNEIVIKGAREHNLKNVNLTLPRDKFIVFTGFFPLPAAVFWSKKVYRKPFVLCQNVFGPDG